MEEVARVRARRVRRARSDALPRKIHRSQYLSGIHASTMLRSARVIERGGRRFYACKFTINRRHKASDEGWFRITSAFSIENRWLNEYRRNGSTVVVTRSSRSVSQRAGEMQHGCEEEGEEEDQEEGRKKEGEAEVASPSFLR
ncbi:MAG: hypothetical protein IT562_21135, partial [Alphaproteobacteria bacterium]|nr:hypothetical protein [Alphaproteobacteria bacterium]